MTGIHGDELEGQYVAFLLNQELQRHPEYLRGTADIYPAMNPLGINTIQRGVPLFDLDMNRIFPGYMQGGTTQRIAGALFDAVKGYRYGIHFASFYLPDDFVPHVRIMDNRLPDLVTGQPVRAALCCHAHAKAHRHYDPEL